MRKRTFYDRRALRERIARVAVVANADRIVFHDVAICIHTTRSRARIHALFVDARHISGTSLVYYAFRTAVRRATHVIR